MDGKLFNKVAVILLSCFLVAGCTGGNSKNYDETKSTLKVLYNTEGNFYQQYGDVFSVNNKNIDFEVISTQGLNNNLEGKTYEEAFDELVQKENPDILLLSTGNYEKYVADGKLVELDPFIDKDKYNLEGIYPGLIDMLKEMGGNKLYGLAPTFYGNALFYNKELFSKYGVELPHDGITWQDIIDLARRFPVDGDEKSRIYGFGNDFPISVDHLVSIISNSEGLMNVNPGTMKVTVDTDSWKKVYQLAIDADKSGAIYNPKDGGFMGGSIEEYYQSQAFLMGRVAMMIGDPYTLQNLKLAQDTMKDYKPIDVGIVSGPVNSTDPATTMGTSMNEIFAINANSPNKEAAWKFIKFVNGEDYARIKSRTMNGNLLTRMSFNKDFEGQSLDVFYALKPKVNGNNTSSDKIPSAFNEQFQSIMSREIALIQENKKSLDEAIKTIQAEGQVALDNALINQEKNKGNPNSSTDNTNKTDQVIIMREDEK